MDNNAAASTAAEQDARSDTSSDSQPTSLPEPNFGTGLGHRPLIDVRELYNPTMVTIRVGEAVREFKVPRALVQAHSAYFRKAFDKKFKEGQEGLIVLPDVPEDIMETFVGWLYTQRIFWHPAAHANEDTASAGASDVPAGAADLPLGTGTSIPKNGLKRKWMSVHSDDGEDVGGKGGEGPRKSVRVAKTDSDAIDGKGLAIKSYVELREANLLVINGNSTTDEQDPENAGMEETKTKDDRHAADGISSMSSVPPEEEDGYEAFSPEDPMAWSWHDLFELYIFADKYDTKGLRHEVLNIIQISALQLKPEKYDYPRPWEHAYAFEQLPLTSPLCRFLLDLETWASGLDVDLYDWSVLSSDVLAKLWVQTKQLEAFRKCCKCQGRRTRNPDDGGCHCDNCRERYCDAESHKDVTSHVPPYIASPCLYHEHDSEAEERLCQSRWDLIREERDIDDESSFEETC